MLIVEAGTGTGRTWRLSGLRFEEFFMPDAVHDEFTWVPQPKAALLVDEWLELLQTSCSALDAFAKSARAETGTRLSDWVDHLVLPTSDLLCQRLIEAGFSQDDGKDGIVFSHSDGLFPRFELSESRTQRLAVRVESVVDFLAAHGINAADQIQGSPGAVVRSAIISSANDVELLVVERHGLCDDGSTGDIAPDRLAAQSRIREVFRLRRREFESDASAFDHADELVSAAIEEIGVDAACDLFFAAEREYWQRRNRAAQIQKLRQDRLGLGWANHDHHTYRSSRRAFHRLIGLFEQLGCVCRERFYAGKDAGWGAQVMENPRTRIVIFADVDLSPEEVFGDFAHEPLADRDQLGTVGLWCRLHGEAVLQAGMHHLECQFDFEAAREQLLAENVRTMKPFTDLPFLRQAFTEGALWPVAAARIEAVLRDGLITAEQAEQFRQVGAIGSHMEILQRNDGYKGFNQTGINEIIRDTDPRRLVASVWGQAPQNSELAD